MLPWLMTWRGVRSLFFELRHHGGEADQDAEHDEAEKAEQRQHHERKQADRDHRQQQRHQRQDRGS